MTSVRRWTDIATEHKGVNNRLLMKLGWVEAIRGNRTNPRNSDLQLVERWRLMEMYRELIRARKDAVQFIGQVFGSKDEVWVERCQSIVREGGPSGIPDGVR